MLCLFIVEVWSQLASPLPAAPLDRNRGQPDTWEKIIGFVRAPLISAAPCLMLFLALAAGRRPRVAAALSAGPRSAPPHALLLTDPPVSVSVLTLIEAGEKRMLRCAANLG